MRPRTTAKPGTAATGTLETLLRSNGALLRRHVSSGPRVDSGSPVALAEPSRAECETGGTSGKGVLQRRAAASGDPSTVSPIVHDVLSTPGQPLDTGARSLMEGHFQHDFSSVRVHTDARAAESARSVSALAYTVGRDVVFGAGQYAPQSSEGQKLLAHELTHVVAQNGSPATGPLRVGPAGDQHEREAEAQSERVAATPQEQAAPDIHPTSPKEGGRLQRAFLGGAGGIVGFIAGSTAAGAAIGGLIGGGVGALIGAGVGLLVSGLISLIGSLLSGSSTPDKVRMVSGGYVGNIEGSTNNRREEVLQAMDRLHILWAMPNADYNAEYPVVAALPANSRVPKSKIKKTIDAIGRLGDARLNPEVAGTVLNLSLTANVGSGQTNNRDDIMGLQDALHVDWMLSNPDYTAERAAVTGAAGPTIADATIPKTLAGIPKMKMAFVAGEIRRDLFVGTHPVTEAQHVAVEHVLNPTTTVTAPPPPPPVVGGPPPPPPVISEPPAMTGTGPGGTFETEMFAMLDTNVGGWASEFRTLKAAGPPAFPITEAHDVTRAAQGEVEHYFGPYIRTATRDVADAYHPGPYSLVSNLGDISTRPLNDDKRRGFLNYLMTLRADCRTAPCGQDILDTHNFLGSRDSAELARVRDAWMAAPAHVTDIDDAMHGWPAVKSGADVFIQPYQSGVSTDDIRKERWDLYTTLIHEMMHMVTHPNYNAAANRIGGTGRKILMEGFADVMRRELWDGPGRLESRLGTREMAPVRRQVEGSSYDYRPDLVQYHPDYTEVADARTIDTAVGHENAKAAFFLGHVELMGLGTGTRTESGAALPPDIAAYAPTDEADAQVIVVSAAGDTYENVRDRAGAADGVLLNDATGAALPPATPIAGGTRVRIPGIRWVPAIAHDTLGSVAQQHHVTLEALARANGLPAGSPATTPLVAGTRVLIPIHRSLP